MLNNRPNPIPGLKSPLFIGSFVIGAGLLLFGKSETAYDAAVYALAIAGTALMTSNTAARATAVMGGWMRLCYEPNVRAVGFFAQSAAVIYAARESTRAASGVANPERNPRNRG